MSLQRSQVLDGSINLFLSFHNSFSIISSYLISLPLFFTYFSHCDRGQPLGHFPFDLYCNSCLGSFIFSYDFTHFLGYLILLFYIFAFSIIFQPFPNCSLKISSQLVVSDACLLQSFPWPHMLTAVYDQSYLLLYLHLWLFCLLHNIQHYS